MKVTRLPRGVYVCYTAQFEAHKTCNTTATLKNAQVNTSLQALNISIYPFT